LDLKAGLCDTPAPTSAICDTMVAAAILNLGLHTIKTIPLKMKLITGLRRLIAIESRPMSE
jgi:hypothetical protein